MQRATQLHKGALALGHHGPRRARLATPGPRKPLLHVEARIVQIHPGPVQTARDSAGHQLHHYIHFLNSRDAEDVLAQPHEDPFQAVASATEEDSENGSQTEAEAEEVRQMIKDLQAKNDDLQVEMDRLVAGLADLLNNINHTSKSDKALVASLRPALSRRAAAPGPVHPSSPPADPNAHVSCVIQHPGALCCTRTVVREEPAGRAVTVAIETTARATDDAAARGMLSQEELGGLAAQALLSAASDHLGSRTRAINSHARAAAERARHDELCAVLQAGDVVEARANPVISQFGHESFVVTLQDEVTGRRLKALFKPRVEGDADGWHRVPMEWVAYRLNLLLGLDYVPPVAYRSGGITFRVTDGENAGQEVSFAEGAMMYYVEDAHQLRCFPESQWGSPPEPKAVLLSNTRVLDTLLHNSDRHHGHFLLGRHWCAGGWSGDRWVGELRPVLIDHAASFRADADVAMTHENAFRTGPVQCCAAETYLRLRFLDYGALATEFGTMLSEAEIRGMVRRRDAVLRYLDGLVAEQGYSQTVVEGAGHGRH